MHEKKPTLASNPELKSKAASVPKNFERRFSRAACARPFTNNLDPPDPSMSGALMSFVRNRCRRHEEVDRER